MKNNKGQTAINTMVALLVVSVVGLIVGVSLINDFISAATDTTSVTDENVTATNNTEITLANADGNDLVDGTVVVTNTTNGNTLTENSNYTVDLTAGTITFTNVNNTEFGDFAFVDYDFRDEAFVDDSGARTALDQVPILVAIALLLAVVSMAIMRFT